MTKILDEKNVGFMVPSSSVLVTSASSVPLAFDSESSLGDGGQSMGLDGIRKP